MDRLKPANQKLKISVIALTFLLKHLMHSRLKVYPNNNWQEEQGAKLKIIPSCLPLSGNLYYFVQIRVR